MRAIPITKRAIAAKTINKAALNTGNSISTIDRAIIKSPNAIFAILDDLYFDGFVVIVAVVVDVVDVDVALTTPKQILSIPMIRKMSDKRSTVVEIDEPGTNRIIAANKTEIEPSTDLEHSQPRRNPHNLHYFCSSRTTASTGPI